MGSPCAKNSTNIKHATKLCRTKTGRLKITFEGKRCAGIESKRPLCHTKLIANQEQDSDESHEGQPKTRTRSKGQRRRRRISDEMLSHQVKAEDRQQEGQEYLLFDIESPQDDGQHNANLLTVQDEMGFEMMFKGDDRLNQFCTCMLGATHQGAIVIVHNL